MPFTIPAADLNLISQLQSELVLAIIMRDGRIRFRVADSQLYPSHGEWLLRDGIRHSEVVGGFSLLVKQGHVRWLFALSQLNDPATPALTDQQIQDITKLLPLEIGFRVYK